MYTYMYKLNKKSWCAQCSPSIGFSSIGGIGRLFSTGTAALVAPVPTDESTEVEPTPVAVDSSLSESFFDWLGPPNLPEQPGSSRYCIPGGGGGWRRRRWSLLWTPLWRRKRWWRRRRRRRSSKETRHRSGISADELLERWQ